MQQYITKESEWNNSQAFSSANEDVTCQGPWNLLGLSIWAPRCAQVAIRESGALLEDTAILKWMKLRSETPESLSQLCLSMANQEGMFCQGLRKHQSL